MSLSPDNESLWDRVLDKQWSIHDLEADDLNRLLDAARAEGRAAGLQMGADRIAEGFGGVPTDEEMIAGGFGFMVREPVPADTVISIPPGASPFVIPKVKS